MRVLVIGDSIVSGENNGGKSFVDYLSVDGSVIKIGVSGTTLGEYSLYPVDGYSLLAQIKRYEIAVKQADVILLHYGVNDTSALMIGSVTAKQIAIDYVKALDYLRQLNPTAKIKFLMLTSSKEVLAPFARLHCKYLAGYYQGYDFDIDWRRWYDCYRQVESIIRMRLEVVPLVDDYEWMKSHLDVDEIHFTDRGYRVIAERISSMLRRGEI